MARKPLVIAVCGTIRSGSSCTAGVLSALGVPMGRSWIDPKPGNPKGFFEDISLRRFTKHSFASLRNPTPINDFEDRVTLLRNWATYRSYHDGQTIGCKDPYLCFMIHELSIAFPRLKIIVPERDPHSVAESILNRKLWELSIEQCEAIIADTIRWRDEDIAGTKVSALRYPFTALAEHPADTINQIIEFCGLSPTTAQYKEAIAFVDPNLCHFKESYNNE